MTLCWPYSTGDEHHWKNGSLTPSLPKWKKVEMENKERKKTWFNWQIKEIQSYGNYLYGDLHTEVVTVSASCVLDGVSNNIGLSIVRPLVVQTHF